MTAYSNTSTLDFRMGTDTETLEDIPVYTMTITVSASDERTLLSLAYDELAAQSVLLNGRLMIRGELTDEEVARFVQSLNDTTQKAKEKRENVPAE